VKETVERETALRKNGTEFVDEQSEGSTSVAYRDAVNLHGSPSTTVSDTYSWTPGTELTRTGNKAA
jgi:hypothetical protein